MFGCGSANQAEHGDPHVAFEIKSRQSLTNPNSVGEILLSEFYRDIGLAENFVVAADRAPSPAPGTTSESLAADYAAAFGVPWRSPEAATT